MRVFKKPRTFILTKDEKAEFDEWFKQELEPHCEPVETDGKAIVLRYHKPTNNSIDDEINRKLREWGIWPV